MEPDLHERLDRSATAPEFTPADAAVAIRAGARIRRRRRFTAGLTATSVIAVLGIGAAALVTSSHDAPSLDFSDPGDRAAAVGVGGPADGYPDLVVQVVDDGSVTITGFGWPLEGQEVVSSRDGRVAFPSIGRVDAEAMCLPMLNQAAPMVPDAAWHHSEAWVDGFPTRAGLITTFEAASGGRDYVAECTLPGDHVPARRPRLERVPTTPAGILQQCGYLAHVDLRAWHVQATARRADAVAAALVAPDGTVGRCVLAADRRQRVVQLSRDAEGPVFYTAAAGTVSLAGHVDPSVTRLRLGTADGDRDVTVTDGAYAALLEGAEPESVTAYDAAGRRVDGVDTVLPTVCFTPVETGDDGC
jgi:hypothetical protein